MTKPKVPRQPGGRPLACQPDDIISIQPVLWRIHTVRGRHAQAWNDFRDWGPVAGMRWEPHPTPPAVHPGFGVTYATTDPSTAVAEVFQRTRVVRPAADKHLTSWTPVRPLRLLDLTGRWAVRAGASYALTSAPKPTCRNWANAIRVDLPDIDGLWTHSTLTGDATTVLFEPARDSFPAAPPFSEPLDAGPVWALLRGAATDIGFRFASP